MNDKVNAAATKYRVARNAIVFLTKALSDPEPVPQMLANADVKAFSDDGDSAPVTAAFKYECWEVA
jgi:hypothetical protein